MDIENSDGRSLSAPGWRWKFAWSSVLVPSILLALGWCVLMPGGFPTEHPRFWLNRVLPVVLVLVSVVAFWAVLRQRWTVATLLLASFPVSWTAGAVAAWGIFPHSLGRASILGLILAVVSAASLRRMPFRPSVGNSSLLGLIVVVSSLLSVFAVWALRGADPATRPLNVPTVTRGEETTHGQGDPPRRQLNANVTVDLSGQTVAITARGLSVEIAPVLTFHSVSPDRCWTIFSRRSDRRPLPWHVTYFAEGEPMAFRYPSEALLQVMPRGANGSAEIESMTRLEGNIYSHLNTFCRVTIRGCPQPCFLTFSPCPSQRVQVTVGDYPFGRPRRSAYLDAADTFHVVEAWSAEKGPFRDLASGPLLRHEPLAIELRDNDHELLRLTWDDFAAQADVSPSPTAGWGLSCNSVVFTLDPGTLSTMVIFVSLSSTSMGRGFDTVGHAAGTYRNRMRVEVPQ